MRLPFPRRASHKWNYDHRESTANPACDFLMFSLYCTVVFFWELGHGYTIEIIGKLDWVFINQVNIFVLVYGSSWSSTYMFGQWDQAARRAGWLERSKAPSCLESGPEPLFLSVNMSPTSPATVASPSPHLLPYQAKVIKFYTSPCCSCSPPLAPCHCGMLDGYLWALPATKRSWGGGW